MTRPFRLRTVAATVAATLLLTAGCTARDDAPPPAAATPSVPAAPGATNTVDGVPNPFGAHWDWSRYQQFGPYLRRLAGSATYEEISWCEIERTSGQADWAGLDEIATRSRELGITLHLKIRTGVCWATGGTARHTRGTANKTESAMPTDLGAYQRFVRSVVQRYGPYGVREYAIENEVNAPSYWAGSPEDYARLVRAAAETIRATDPKARVVDSGISSVAYGMGVADRLVRAGRVPEAITAYQAYFQRRVGTRGQQIPAVTGEAQLRRALGTETNSRSLRFLAVTESLLTDRTVDVRQVHFYEHFSGVAPLLDYLRATTPAGTPLQAWEVGQFWRDGDGDPAGRAAEMVKTVTLLAAGGIGEISWLPLAYNPNNAAGSEVRYGLLDPDGTERESGRMLAALADAARGATVTPLPASVAGRLNGVAFVRGGSSTLVLWSASNTPVTVPAAPGGRTGAVGSPLGAAGGGTTVTDVPVLLRADQPVERILATVRLRAARGTPRTTRSTSAHRRRRGSRTTAAIDRSVGQVTMSASPLPRARHRPAPSASAHPIFAPLKMASLAARARVAWVVARTPRRFMWKITCNAMIPRIPRVSLPDLRRVCSAVPVSSKALSHSLAMPPARSAPSNRWRTSAVRSVQARRSGVGAGLTNALRCSAILAQTSPCSLMSRPAARISAVHRMSACSRRSSGLSLRYSSRWLLSWWNRAWAALMLADPPKAWVSGS